MRLINTACEPDYIFSIDDHDMTVIEADSIPHEPCSCIGASQLYGTVWQVQRYSFILEANQPVGNYWIHADPSIGDGGFNGGINSAILRYVGAPEIEPPKDFVAAKKKPGNMLNEADLHPIASQNHGDPVPTSRATTFAINGVEYVSPPLPVLLQVLSGAQKPGALLPAGSVYGLLANSSIEISITGGGVKGFEHPMHLHGHAFDVVRVYVLFYWTKSTFAHESQWSMMLRS
ncbi:hypothetical protein MPER_12893 [Moniliophthora perniciosa FA553]|nr:hypothetical protein MPER_12893 [Moniliophthora perniciosa FA553]